MAPLLSTAIWPLIISFTQPDGSRANIAPIELSSTLRSPQDTTSLLVTADTTHYVETGSCGSLFNRQERGTLFIRRPIPNCGALMLGNGPTARGWSVSTELHCCLGIFN